jgi:hypothetical protein
MKKQKDDGKDEKLLKNFNSAMELFYPSDLRSSK